MKIGILGGGQLAKMLALSAKKLGIEVICIDPALDCCASQVAPVIHADFHEVALINQAFQGISCVTYETENLPFEAVSAIAKMYPMMPDAEALSITQDRWLEKNFLKALSIPTTSYYPIDHWADLVDAMKALHFPLVLKTRLHGYDGKGQFIIQNEREASAVWGQTAKQGLIAESWVPYQFEVSLIVARSTSGEMVFYPLTKNNHQQGILRVSEAPYLDSKLQRMAEDHALKISEALHYAGILCIEFFCVNDQLIVNELAPRVHNSGHWTIEGAATSQFENHLRAITGLPLGPTTPHGFSVMLNCIGEEPHAMDRLTEIPGLSVHCYGKAPRPNRKVGHITICAPDEVELSFRVKACKTQLNFLSQNTDESVDCA